jgi:exo-beta-1,3-glucanase (GH17 family)
MMRADVIRGLEPGNAICYSGYREGQSPWEELFPSLEEIREDLHMLKDGWRYLRLYDSSLHAERVLQVIEEDGLEFLVLLGAHIGAEVNNPECPWGAQHTDEELAANRKANEAECARAVGLAERYRDIVFAVAVGNEATVHWTDHLVPVERMIQHVRWVRQRITQPVTFCENYVPWQGKLRDLVPEIDFISVHTYPVWEFKTIHNALDYSKENLASVAREHPGVPIVITEAGWTTRSNGRGIPPEHTGEEWQAAHVQELLDWSRESGLMIFVFEAFDEPWKGSADPHEPEKHWGLYTVDRHPKQVARTLNLFGEVALESD